MAVDLAITRRTRSSLAQAHGAPVPAPAVHPSGAPRALAALLLALVVALPVGWPAAAAASDLDRARELAADGRFADALAVIDSVLQARPEDVPALLLRGVVLSRAGRSDEAIDVFNVIARARPELPEPHNNLAVLYAAQGRYDEARSALVEAIRLQPDYALAHENLGDVYTKLAALSYARASQIDPGNTGAADKSVAAENLLGDDGTAPPVPVRVTRAVAPAPAPAAAAAADEVCVRVAGITPASRADDVVRWFRQRGLQAAAEAAAARSDTNAAYRVYIPSLGSKAAARERIAELRATGISDLIMITDASERHGISLGVFRQRASAERRARQLRERGIDTHIAGLGASQPTPAVVIARGVFTPAAFADAHPDLLPAIVECP